jgi:hypothetical protein
MPVAGNRKGGHIFAGRIWSMPSLSRLGQSIDTLVITLGHCGVANLTIDFYWFSIVAGLSGIVRIILSRTGESIGGLVRLLHWIH